MNANTPSGQATALGFLRVLDLSESIAGQFCCRMLADYGAEVNLIEPAAGSTLRRVGPFDPTDGSSLLFFHLNLNKRSLRMDAESTAGRTLLHELAATVDVLVVPAGFDRAALREAWPQVIVCVVSPFGEDGPRAHWKGTEMVYQAMSGSMIQNGSGNREPLYGTGDRASFSAGIAAYDAVLGALMARERLGVGQEIAIDIAHVAASMTYPFALQHAYNGSFERRGERGTPLLELRCAEAYLAVWVRPLQFPTVCEVLGAPELLTDPRFLTPADRSANFKLFAAELQQRVQQRQATDLVAALQSRRIVAACCFHPTQIGPDALHLVAREYWQQVQTEAGKRWALGPQFRLSRTPRRALHALEENE